MSSEPFVSAEKADEFLDKVRPFVCAYASLLDDTFTAR
jgi:hypothetical protein